MIIEEEALRHWIENFYGYGSWSARFWFVAYEEGGGELPEDVAERINYFKAHHSQAGDSELCDIRQLYGNVTLRWQGPKAKLYRTLYDFRFGENATPHTIWKNLTSFEYAIREEPLPDFIDYQRRVFASPAARNEAVLKLFPLPAAHHHGWYYSWLLLPGLEFIRSRTNYEEILYPLRMQRILSNIKTYKPELVLFYGMSNISTLKASVQKHFPQAQFTLFKAVKRHIPQYHRADLEGTTLLITTQIPALRHQRVETGFDWEAFGKAVKGTTVQRR